MIISVKPTNQTTLSPSEKFAFRTINLLLVALCFHGTLTLALLGRYESYYLNSLGFVLVIQLVVDFIKYRLAGSPLTSPSHAD